VACHGQVARRHCSGINVERMRYSLRLEWHGSGPEYGMKYAMQPHPVLSEQVVARNMGFLSKVQLSNIQVFQLTLVCSAYSMQQRKSRQIDFRDS
jgi:hypothetical protein